MGRTLKYEQCQDHVIHSPLSTIQGEARLYSVMPTPDRRESTEKEGERHEAIQHV